MYRLKSPEIYASEIAEFIHSKLIGIDFIVSTPVSINNLISNSFSFLNKGQNINIEHIPQNALIICSSSENIPKNCSYIISNNPKLDFVRTINEFFVEIESYKIAKSAIIHPSAKIAHNVSIGENCLIGSDSVIGDNTQILNNVIIGGRVEIGNNCLIKDNSTIGSEGYDFEVDEEGNPIHYPHIGKIIIGNNVWIGSNSTIESAAINDTIIGKHSKIDDIVHIGSGCNIEDGCMITAGVIISRNVYIKQNTTIAPNATLKENIIIGQQSIIGTGSVVVKNIDDNIVVVGNPAHFLKNK